MTYREGEEDNFFYQDDNNALNIQTNAVFSAKKANNKDL